MPSLKNIFLMIVVFGGLLACQNDKSNSERSTSGKIMEKTAVQASNESVDKTSNNHNTSSTMNAKDTSESLLTPIINKEYQSETRKNKTNDLVKEEVKNDLPKKKTIKKRLAKQKRKKKHVNKGSISFYNTIHNYGRIEMGEKVNHTFQFINNGKGPLNILDVDVSCGCTTPTYPFIPIEPGKMGKIQVHFDSDNRLGPQESTITVKTDGTVKEVELTLVGEVITDIAQPLDSL